MMKLSNAYCCNASHPPAGHTAPLGLPGWNPGAPAPSQAVDAGAYALAANAAAHGGDGQPRYTPADLESLGYAVNAHGDVRDALRERGHDAGREDRSLTDLMRAAGMDVGREHRGAEAAIEADRPRRFDHPEPLGLPQWTPEPDSSTAEAPHPTANNAARTPEPLGLPGW